MNRFKFKQNYMRQNLKLSFLTLFFVACSVNVAVGQQSNNRKSSNTDWSVFVENNPKECWSVSSPKETVNTKNGKIVSIRRGQILLFTFFRPASGVSGQVSFTPGYPFGLSSPVTLSVGSQTFELSVDGEWAWPSDEADDKKIIAALKRGRSATLVASSARGTVTKDTFSLSGYTAATNDAAARCGMATAKPKLEKPIVKKSTPAAQN